MATLTNTKIKDTYKSLLKVSDNGNLEASLQEITDGEGNASGVQLNTGGDLTASGTVAFGSLKDSGENITIAKFVDEADGIAGNDNDTSIPTSAAVKDYVDTKVTAEDLDFAGDSGTGAVDLDSQTFTIAGTANEIETSASGQTITIGLPSTITANVIGNVSGNLTGTVLTAAQTNITSVGTLSSLAVSGDLTIDTNTLFVDASANKVGIGTTTPSKSVLDVLGTNGITTAASIGAFNDGYFATFESTYGNSGLKIKVNDLNVITTQGFNQPQQLLFHTYGGGSSQERMRIDSSGNVGIGSSNTGYGKLGVYDASNSLLGIANSTSYAQLQQNGADLYINTNLSGAAGGNTIFRRGAGSTESMRIDSSGSLTVTADASTIATLKSVSTGGNNQQLIVQSGGDRVILDAQTTAGATTNLAFETGNAERMRIDSSGNLILNKTATVFADAGYYFSAASNQIAATSVGAALALNKLSTDGQTVQFYRNTVQVGNISVTGSATAYNTSSDYRLKENVVPMEGALDRVDALKPSRFNFIADPETTVDGFLAHEVAEVIPEAISGEKDAVEEYEVTPAVLDEDGNVIEEAVMGTRPVYQGIDQSKIVPLLVGAIKELSAKVAALESQLS